MKIAIGSDHKGFSYKQYIIDTIHIKDIRIAWHDVGCFSIERCDYPEFAQLVVNDILSGNAEFGILLCGSGIGMSIAANRFKGIYAGLVWNREVAIAGRQDDNVNVLVLPADFVSLQDSVTLVHAWLTATFKGGRYEKRIQMIDHMG